MSMYSSSFPVFQKYLINLSSILNIGAAYGEAMKIEETVLTSSRLYPDMFPLSRQVQIACDVAKAFGGRMSDVEAPKFEDTETTFAELESRIQNTLAFLATLTPEQIDGTEEKQINIKAGPNELEFTGKGYLENWALPNIYFHITTTYNILRHNGVVLGKKDFLA